MACGNPQHCEGSVNQIKPMYVAMYLCGLTRKTLPINLWQHYVTDVFLSLLCNRRNVDALPVFVASSLCAMKRHMQVLGKPYWTVLGFLSSAHSRSYVRTRVLIYSFGGLSLKTSDSTQLETSRSAATEDKRAVLRCRLTRHEHD